jgi:imidazolonepropionase-like amidohydrolase
MYISVRKGIIAEIGSMARAPISSVGHVIDLNGRYALPGLIDLHVHVVEEAVTELARHRTISDDGWPTIRERAARNLHEALQAGITSICDCGSPNDFTLRIRKAVQTSQIRGPRLFVCGPILTAPGGHGASWGKEVSGQNLAQAIRELADLKVDFIKIVNDPIAYTLVELVEAVAEAHRLGLKVACHAFTEDAIWLALKAGCDSIEHGVVCSPEMASYIQKHGMAIIPTFVTALKSSEDLSKSLVSQEDADKYFYPWLDLLQRQLPITLAADGIRLGAGTDAGFPPIHFASLIEELHAFVKMGASTFKALSSATSSASEIRGLDHNLGAIQVGKTADIIATSQNPLESINALEKVSFVMQGGRLIKYQIR